MEYSDTYFELDSEEATHCNHCQLISCVYIKGLVNTKEQSNACMCEMMSKRSKEALTVLIVTHVPHVKGLERSLNSSNSYSCYSCRKVQRITLCTQYRYIQCYVERVKRLCYVETKDIHIFTHNFLNIQAIFSLKKVLESCDLDLSNHTIQCNICRSMSKGSKVKITSTPLTYIALDGVVGTVKVSAFQNFFLD